MSPGPDNRREPAAPDRSNENRVSEIVIADETVEATAAAPPPAPPPPPPPPPPLNAAASATAATTDTAIPADNNLASLSSEILVNATIVNPDNNEFNDNQSTIVLTSGENKQEEPAANCSTLNEGELRALLDEALTYKSPKDREGKSNLFKELLQEVEADETEEGRRIVASSRCIPGSNRRRHKRDSVSERLTHGGSLQNLAQPINSEFDSSFAYLTSGSSHTYGGGRRKGKKHTGPSVSARQREGGSLPSNVNASHSLASLANLDLVFDKKKGFSEERSVYDWTNKEKSKSLDKPSYGCPKKDDKDKKDSAKRESAVATIDGDSEVREKKIAKGKIATNEMHESDNPPPEYKPDYMVIDFDFEVEPISNRNAVSSESAVLQRPHSIDIEDDEGTEMKIIEPRRPVQVVSRANFDAPQSTPVDTTVEFPIREQTGSKQGEKPKTNAVNGTNDGSGTLPLQTYNSVKCVVSGTLNLTASTPQGKVISSSLYSVMPWPTPNIAMEAVSRLTQHIPSAEKKSLDENGNAVQGHNGERKKVRRKHTQEPNVIVYKAENVEGHRNIEDIDTIVEFIENKESKGKKGKASNAVRVKTASGAKPRTREKDAKREQMPAKLHKSNSLEEISKTKLEDLTAEKSTCSSGASSVSSQHGAINVALRRAKQRSTGDSAVDSRGDRRSWGTEEGQSIYCNDTGDDYTSRKNSTKKINTDAEMETEFLVVTKKKKSKKQRRSSSGGRPQNLASSGSYLQRSGGFANDYRTPLSPELRRKSTSSMPPSDKSDSSDLDSVHSLPVTSNSSKHNSSKNSSSPGGASQASYADIARTATINMSPMGSLNITTMVPNMLNTGSWPSVPAKAPSEPDKFPQDYYPSLDEVQQSDRKLRQHTFAHSNNIQGLSLSFEKPPSPTLAKLKNSAETKKAEAREEAINKNIQVFKYVQDIEKLHQSLSQQQQQHKQIKQTTSGSNNNPTIPSSNVISTQNENPSNNSGKINSPPSQIGNTTVDSEQTNNYHDNANAIKDTNANARVTYNRSRRNYQQSSQTTQQPNHHSAGQESQREGRTTILANVDDINKNALIPTPNNHDDKDAKKSGISINSSSSSQDELDILRTKIHVNAKFFQQQQQQNAKSSPNDSDNSSISSVKTDNVAKTGRISRTSKEQIIVVQSDSVKTGNVQNSKKNRQDRSVEAKRSKLQHSGKGEKEIGGKTAESQQQNSNRRNFSSRPAVILMDESSTDPSRNGDSPSELTFGFEVNEQLLMSEQTDEASIEENTIFSTKTPQIFNKPPPNFDRPPPPYEKHHNQQQHQQHQRQHVRYEKIAPNFSMHPSHVPHHQGIPHPQTMIAPMPYMGYLPGFRPLGGYPQPPPPQPSSIMEKYHHQPKEDFSARYVAPEETPNVHNYNHDKIVTFVGLAWDAVMREIPVTAASGRVQYYSGQ